MNNGLHGHNDNKNSKVAYPRAWDMDNRDNQELIEQNFITEYVRSV